MLWKIEFYNNAVEASIKKWPDNIIPKFLWLLNIIGEFGPDKIGTSYVKDLGKGLFKITIKNNNDMGCALFCASEQKKTIIILHGFITTTPKISPADTALARTYMSEISVQQP